LGRRGVVKVWEYDLSDSERAELEKSAEAVKSTNDALRSLVRF
jgi:malate/lactate dehydrogenase